MKKKMFLFGLGFVALTLASCDTNVIPTLEATSNDISETSAESSSTSDTSSQTSTSSSEVTTTTITTSSGEETITSSESTTSYESSSSEETTTSSTSGSGSNAGSTECVVTETELKFSKFGGDQESIYAEFNPIAGASEYKVYYKKSSDDSYSQVDSELVRKYKDGDSYKLRVDQVGLEAGTYDLRVDAVVNGVEETEASIQNIKCIAYDRTGFAFSNASGSLGSGSGAYNDNGVLKSDAQVIYVDATNASTVTATVNGTVQTGLQGILYAKQKKTSTEKLDIRIIGEIKASNVDYFGSSAEGIQIKGASSYQDMGVTIEGIGEDATINGFGFLLRNAANVEIRNLGIMNFMDDGISMDTNNKNLFIHDNDFFYGQAGGDSDQAKGDGTTDIKGDSQFVTISYNHYFDSGKSSLCGMKSESGPNYISYHHNWFDHSDSRHPRVRTMSVHVYNNYFDGNAKYGVGATTGSSVFVEGNYFRNCKNPMLASLQGTDAKGDGTFSGENGGLIKAYNNTVIGASSLIYQTESATSFDAYLVESRNTTLGSNVTALVGGTTYDNFDQEVDLGVEEANIEDPTSAKDTVQNYAGRVNGGDFKWTFTEEDDTSYAIDTELKSKVTNYSNTDLILSTSSNSGSSGSGNTSSDNTEETNTTTSEETSTTGLFYVANKTVVSSGATFTYTGSLKTKSIPTYTYGSLELSQALKLDSAGSVTFTLVEKTTVSVVLCGKSAGATVYVGDNLIALTATPKLYTFELEAGTYTIKRESTESWLYLISF